MCGIFFIAGQINDKDLRCMKPELLKPRGPDCTTVNLLHKDWGYVFHRLAIMDPVSPNSNQPFISDDGEWSVWCNGEIYNWRQLSDHYKVQCRTQCDCEIILRLVEAGIDITTLSRELDGDFAFVIMRRLGSHEASTDFQVWAGRDLFGVRPLFVYRGDGIVCFASELKAFRFPIRNVNQVQPGTNISFNVNGGIISHYTVTVFDSISSSYTGPYSLMPTQLSFIKSILRTSLERSVRKRLQSDRPLGCLLSGGLDSSLIAALVARLNYPVETFSIGLVGSTDIEYANKVAQFLNINRHHSVICSEAEFLEAIPDVIKCIESYDVTTVRASTPMFLLARYIAKTTDIKVVLSGEGADELCQGYLYFRKQPDAMAGDRESRRLLHDLAFFDVLRADRTVSAHGLELRVPFLDKDFVKQYLSVPAHLRSPLFDGVEKSLLRHCFDGDSSDSVLPPEILFRQKEAFSDGVSSRENSWFAVIQRHADAIVSDDEMKMAAVKWIHNTPRTKEAYWFRSIFEREYGGMGHVIPYQWMPKWVQNVTDPSARVLDVY